MHFHSPSERSVGYLFLMRARVANHYPTHPFRTVSPRGWANRVRSKAGASCAPAAALTYHLAVFRTRRLHEDLPVERVRSRVSAYIYGNIFVLAAIFATSPESVAHLTAVVIVGATSATTFFAHVVAHNIGQAIGRTDEEDLRVQLSKEARDAVPIMTSGTVPAVLLGLGAVGWLSSGLSQLLAEAYVVVRLAGTGIVVRRLSGAASRKGGFWSGLALAVIGIGIAALKQVITH